MKPMDLIHKSAGVLATVRQNLRKAEPARLTDPKDLFGAVGQPLEKDWTVLVVMDGRHRLAHSTDLAINKLEQVGSTDRVNLVVQATQEPTLPELCLPNMQSLPTRRYYITQDQAPQQITSPVLEEFPGQAPLTAESLGDAVAWAVEKFPARHYMVIVKKHGAGFASVSRGQDQVVPLSARECAEGLRLAEERTGRKIDVLGYDSCSMQQVEVGYQLRDHVDVIMGSEEDVLAVAYPYGSAMAAVNLSPPSASPELVARALVTNYSRRVHSGLQSAVSTAGLEGLAHKFHAFVDQAIGQHVDPRLLYTSMMDTPPMDRSESLKLNYNFRDLGGFLERVALDERYPDPVRQAASGARLSLEESVVARTCSDNRQELRQPTGMTGFFPWKALDEKSWQSYQSLDWVQDSGYGQLLDYVLRNPQTPSPQTPAPGKASGGLAQGFGKWGLYQYKKYISPYLNVSCSYTPSCSQFAREAIEKHGLWEGGKMGALRFFSCNGTLHGDDPVPAHPGCAHPHPIEHGPRPPAAVGSSQTLRQRLGDALITPPRPHTENPRADLLIGGARLIGQAAGAVGLAALTVPAGAAIGAYVGWKSGRGQLESHIDAMLSHSNESVVHGFENIANPLAAPVNKLRHWVEEKTGSAGLAGPLGAVAGMALGAMGGAWQGGLWGQLFGGLWAESRVKESIGELPQDPQTQAILQRDYAA